MGKRYMELPEREKIGFKGGLWTMGQEQKVHVGMGRSYGVEGGNEGRDSWN